MPHVLVGESKTPKFKGLTVTFTDTRMEMRTHFNRFCSGFIKKLIKPCYYMGDSGLTYEVFSFSYNENY